MLLADGEDIAAAVCAADWAGMMGDPRTAALRADDEVRN